ncbi:uncharacterized protein CLUP02_00901 [Colletotrichum lupini]|uniref:Uncharacterized protein n=1 Tax=Colletotrichum lupini TaxID=145971 RepID=A0A9Q8SBZ0_9PEZI|nr:uncharacterized protein CLUP02_00901 [Colletotrichum lupini]UQC74253.1 hypothetical protein CLUP02_00901 [Colletotrichum lupini]
MGCRAQDLGLEFSAELLLPTLAFPRLPHVIIILDRSSKVSGPRETMRLEWGWLSVVKGGFKRGQPQLMVQESAESWRRGCEEEATEGEAMGTKEDGIDASVRYVIGEDVPSSQGAGGVCVRRILDAREIPGHVTSVRTYACKYIGTKPRKTAL